MMESGKRKVESGKWSCRTRIALLFPLSVLLLISSCAKQGYPSGGPRDVQPPAALGTKPENESRHFADKQFYIQFDEYVVLKDADNNVLVSPPLKHKAEYKVKGKGVQVKIHDTLQENTTYLFQFKNAIADFNEGNMLPSYEYVFSTGDAMDTMMVAGRVLGARNGKPWKEALAVAAYREERCTTDTVATELQPDFVTRTDDSGCFAFHYIPAGRYRFVAFEDKDRDLRVGNSEAVAWDESFYAAADSIDSTAVPVLRVSAPDTRKQRLLKAEFPTRGRITITTFLPMQSPVLTGEPVVWRLNERRDTMTVWCLNEQCDSVVMVLDDSATSLHDTIKLKYRARARMRGDGTSGPSLPRISALCASDRAYYDDLRLAFRTPVAKVRDNVMAEVMLLKDSSIRNYPVILGDDSVTARIMATLTAGEKYRLRMDDSLFTDIYGHPYDSLNFVLTPKDYGILTLHVTNLVGNPLVVEVLDKRDTVVQRQATLGSGTLQFIHLPAAEYRLRAVVDRDGNGEWTAGDYRLQRQPEECIMFGKTLQLREKWEMEEKWEIKLEDGD